MAFRTQNSELRILNVECVSKYKGATAEFAEIFLKNSVAPCSP